MANPVAADTTARRGLATIPARWAHWHQTEAEPLAAPKVAAAPVQAPAASAVQDVPAVILVGTTCHLRPATTPGLATCRSCSALSAKQHPQQPNGASVPQGLDNSAERVPWLTNQGNGTSCGSSGRIARVLRKPKRHCSPGKVDLLANPLADAPLGQ
jgi:hypothetical protein